MDRKGATLFRGYSYFSLIVVSALLIAISPVRAVEPAAAAPATQLADGVWTVQGRAIQGTRRCGDWMVRLTNAGGQLSGVVSLARSSVPIQNLTLQPDGTFSGRYGVVKTSEPALVELGAPGGMVDSEEILGSAGSHISA